MIDSAIATATSRDKTSSNSSFFAGVSRGQLPIRQGKKNSSIRLWTQMVRNMMFKRYLLSVMLLSSYLNMSHAFLNTLRCLSFLAQHTNITDYQPFVNESSSLTIAQIGTYKVRKLRKLRKLKRHEQWTKIWIYPDHHHWPPLQAWWDNGSTLGAEQLPFFFCFYPCTFYQTPFFGSLALILGVASNWWVRGIWLVAHCAQHEPYWLSTIRSH